MDETRESIRGIKKEFRLFMNGVTSAHLRKSGMNYNIIFGVDIPHLKEIAGKFPKETTLAKELWRENIRESKLLAIYLLPQESYAQVADEWIAECRYTENADHLAQNILCHLTDACTKALQWVRLDEGLFRYCGFMTLAHCFRQGAGLTTEQEQEFFAEAARHTHNECQKQIATSAYKALDLYFAQDEEREQRYAGEYGNG